MRGACCNHDSFHIIVNVLIGKIHPWVSTFICGTEMYAQVKYTSFFSIFLNSLKEKIITNPSPSQQSLVNT